MEKLLPQNNDAEQWLLGGILYEPETLAQVADFLEPAHFYKALHRSIYEAMLTLSAQGTHLDAATISEQLGKELGEETEMESMCYLSDLFGLVPGSAGVESHAASVFEHWDWRDLIYAAGKIAALGYARVPNARTLAQQLLFQAQSATRSHLVDLREVMSETLLDLERAYQQHSPVTGVPTGYKHIDAMLGGMQPSDLILLAGRPGMGKSACGLCMGWHAAKMGKRVALFSMEMSRKQLGLRLIAMLTGIPVQRLRTGWITDEEYAAVSVAYAELEGLPISIDDAADNPVLAIKSKLLRYQMEKRAKVDLVVIDYLQLMEQDETEKNHHHQENRVQEITQISRGLKKLAMDFNVPILAMAQLSRAVESRAVKIPQLSDLRDSGSLEQDADVVLFAYRDEYYAGFDEHGNSKSDRPGIADIIIAKHRNGETGEVQLKFVGKRTRFYNLDEEIDA